MLEVSNEVAARGRNLARLGRWMTWSEWLDNVSSIINDKVLIINNIRLQNLPIAFLLNVCRMKLMEDKY